MTTLKMILAIASTVILTCAAATNTAAGATVFHVSRAGRDTNPGTEARPFASIARAQQAVRRTIAAGLKAGVTVTIAAGTY